MIGYSPSGAPECCGEGMASGVSLRGDNIATCAKCNKSYVLGSYRQNPTERRPMIAYGFNPFGAPNWVVKDGHKKETQT